MTQHDLQSDDAYSLLAANNAPRGLVVSGVLDYSATSERALPRLPADLTVDVLNLAGQTNVELPARLKCYELNLAQTDIRRLSADLSVAMRLDLRGCDRLEALPEGLTVGTLNLRGCTNLRALPERLSVWFLDLAGCWAFDAWPREANIRAGRLQLRGCTALTSLPPYLERLSALDVCDCPNLRALPAELVVTGWLDLARSGLVDEASLPPGLARTQLRWAGINVDRRIAFHPEQIHVDEVLQETNAERRRALLDRYGYGRFLQNAEAETLDEDVDAGGPRQLLRVKLTGDEDLVALSCFCPSTGRQYMIRVPPTMNGCHRAAAWMAGFDDPDAYQPLRET
jgi:hypothetical protein